MEDAPKGVKLRVWKCEEANGYIFVWHHAEGKKYFKTFNCANLKNQNILGEEPNWNLIKINKIHNGEWKYMGRTEHHVSCHFQVRSFVFEIKCLFLIKVFLI